MRINFAWITPDEKFDALIHNREDEKIFYLEIKQKEAGFARAKITVINPRYGLLWPKDKQFCLISLDSKVLFKGSLHAMPTEFEGELVTLEFTAAPSELDQKKSVLCQDIMSKGTYDPLFFNDQKPSLSQLLQAYTALPYWSRTEGDLKLSDIFKGRKTTHLADQFFADSLSVIMAGQPLSKIKVEINAQWMQQAKGVLEIGKQIKRKLPGGYLSTLTSKSLEEAWWDKDSRFKQNGYHIEVSNLQKINPENTKDYPISSRSFWHFEEYPKKVQFNRSWYDFQLRLGWSYKQKRKERAMFTLEQDIQNITHQQGRFKNLFFRLPSILGKNCLWRPLHFYTEGFQIIQDDSVYRCLRPHKSKEYFEPKKWLKQNNLVHVDGQSARAEFFTTDRGKKAIDYAIEVAKTYLAASARCINIKFRICLSKAIDITLDHTVTIKDPRLPGTILQGKVIQYRFLIDGKTGERVADIVLGVAIGKGISKTSAFNEDGEYIIDDVLNDDVAESTVVRRTKSMICYEFDSELRPPLGITKPYQLAEENIVEDIAILNDAQFQERHLSQKQYPHSMDIKKVLKRIPTNIHLKLKDLRTHECLERDVPIRILTTWSAPQHIDLSAPKE